MYKNIFFSSSLIISASLLFVCNDAVINYLSPRGIQFYHFVFYGAPAYLSVPFYLFFKGTLKYNLRSTNYFIPLLRSLIFLPMPFFAFLCLKNITLPEFTTLNMSSPIFGVIISLLYLKEKMNSYIYVSLLFGVLGVFLVIQPGFENFNPYYLLVLFSAFLITVTSVIVNKYNKVTTSIGYFFYGGIFTHTLSFILFLFDPIMIELQLFFLITFASIVINLAIGLMVVAFQRSLKYYGSLNCLIYVQILWSILFGILIFDEKLNLIASFGAIFIIGSGIIAIPAQHKQIK